MHKILKVGLPVLILMVFSDIRANELNEQQEQQAPSWIEDELLAEYISTALSQNPDIRATEQQYRAALLEAPQARWSLPDPQLSSMFFPQGMLWPGGEQYASISLQQMFPWFGTLSAREAMADIMSEAEFEAYRDRRSQIIYDVREVYYEMFEVQQKIKIKEEHLHLFQSFIDIARSRIETGQGRSSEVLSIEMEREDLRQDIENLHDRVTKLRQDLASLLNAEEPEELSLPDTLEEPQPETDPQELKAQIGEKHPAVSRWDKVSNYYEQKEYTTKLESRPNIGLGAEYMVMSPTDQFDFGHNGDNMIVPMVSISLPIYRSRYNAEREQALLKAEQATERQQSEILRLYRQWEDELAKYRDAERLIEHYREQVHRSNRALSLMQQDYAGQRIVFEEVLRMQQRLLDYEIELTEAIAENNRSIAKLEYLSQRNE